MSAGESAAGSGWAALPAAIRAIHDGVLVRGTAEVTGARSKIFRILARSLGFPAPGQGVPVELRVEPCPGGEVWRRRFGTSILDTRVRLHRGRFAERYRGVELVFDLHADARGLRFEQRGAALVMGPLRLPLPSSLAPRVEAEDQALEEPGSVRFSVVLSLWGDRLVGYAGCVSPEVQE